MSGTNNACAICGSVIYPHYCAVPPAPVLPAVSTTANITYAPPSGPEPTRNLHERIRRMFGSFVRHDSDVAILIRDLNDALLEAERDIDEAKMWRDNATAGWSRAVEERDTFSERINFLESHLAARHDATLSVDALAAAEKRAEAAEHNADRMTSTIEHLVKAFDDVLNIVAPYVGISVMALANHAASDALEDAKNLEQSK